MRITAILFIVALSMATSSNAQNWVQDSVVMGAGYANDIFYSLKNDSVKAAPNNNWHLGVQMTLHPGPYGNVSVIANQVQANVKVYSLHMAASTNFTTLSATDTIGKTGPMNELFNADTSWNYGAFNRMKNPANWQDFSWGMYDQTTHYVNGDSLYMVTIGAGPSMETYKIWIKQYISTPTPSIRWEFRIAKFDGTDDTTILLYRSPNYTDRLFAYYNLITKTESDREPGRSTWDILFTRYKEYLPSAFTYYSVMGVLSNFDVSVSQMEPVAEDDTAGFAGYTYSPLMNEIGSDWKSFNNTTMQWTFKDSTYYFVKTANTNEYYQLHFTNFGGAANGKVVFRKRFLGNVPTSVNDLSTPVNAFLIAPNPANNDATILIDAKEQIGRSKITICDVSGKVAFSGVVNIATGLNGFRVNAAHLMSGTYVVSVTNGVWFATEKLVVQH